MPLAIITHHWQPPQKDSAEAEGLVVGPWTLCGGTWMHGDHPSAALGYSQVTTTPRFHPISKKCSPLGDHHSKYVWTSAYSKPLTRKPWHRTDCQHLATPFEAFWARLAPSSNLQLQVLGGVLTTLLQSNMTSRENSVFNGKLVLKCLMQRHRQPRELWILFCRVLPYTWCDAICGWSRQATQWRRSGLALVAMCMGSRTPVQSAQQHSGTLALKALNWKTLALKALNCKSVDGVECFSFQWTTHGMSWIATLIWEPLRQWWNIPCLSSLMSNRIHQDFCNDQDSTVKTLPKDLNYGFVDWFRLSQVPELNSRTPLSSTAWFRPIGTPRHVFFHGGYDIDDIWKIWKCGQAWPNSSDSNSNFLRPCTTNWSLQQLVMFRHVQTWIAASKMSFRSCAAAKSEMYHHRFWVRPALGLTWSIFAYNDTKLQPLPSTSKAPMGNDGKKRIWPKSTDINWPTPNQSDQLMAFRNQANASAECARNFSVLQQVWIPGR